MHQVDPAPAAPSNAFALGLAAFVLGLLAVTLSVVLAGGLFALAGLVLSAVHLARRRPYRGLAWWGLGFSLAGLLATVGVSVLYYQAFQSYRRHASGAGASRSTATDDWRGASAPALTLTTLDGQKIDLEALKGRRVVLNFWATWCGPCRQEMPHLVRLARETSTDELLVVGISEESEATIEAFARKNGIVFPLVSASDLPSPFGEIRTIPTTFFIDRKGLIQEVRVGYQSFARLKSAALQPDFSGPARAAAVKELVDGPRTLTAVPRWEHAVQNGSGLAVCDWDGDGTSEVLVAQATRLEVLDAAGRTRATVPVPGPAGRIECTRGPSGPRVAWYPLFGSAVSVLDRDGQVLWTYRSGRGAQGARWADLDGDGAPELIVGMSGRGGLHAVGADGRPRWTDPDVANVSGPAAVAAAKDRPTFVFAAEGAGSVHVYDGRGELVREVQPMDEYYTSLDAAVVDGSGAIQVIAAGPGQIAAFDPEGKVAWRAKRAAHGSTAFVHGDLTGDGLPEWVFGGAGDVLTVASPAGERLGEVTAAARGASFVVLPAAKGRGQLVVLAAGFARAYRFE